MLRGRIFAVGPPPSTLRPVDHYLDILPALDAALPAGVRAVMVCPAAAGADARETLANIVKACGLTEGRDCVTLALEGPARLPPVAADAAELQSVVVFGIKPRSVGLVAEAPLYAWTPVLGGRRYCFAERLTLIGEDMARKKRLWATVKSLKV